MVSVGFYKSMKVEKVEKVEQPFNLEEWLKEENTRHDEFILNLIDRIMEIGARKYKNREDD